MGWSFSCTPGRLKDELKDRTAGWTSYADEKKTVVSTKTVCIASKYVMHNPGSGVLFKVMETQRMAPDGVTVVETERWIGVDLLKCHNRCWGYKDMSEESGPNELGCPLLYIDKLAPDRGYCGKVRCPGWDVPKPGDHCEEKSHCHGCGRCWAQSWRDSVRKRAHEITRRRQFMNSLKKGDVIVIAKGWKGAGDQLTVSEVDPRRRSCIAGYTRVPARAIDVDASLEAVGVPAGTQ